MSTLLSLIPDQPYNTTLLSYMTPTSLQYPIYHTSRPALFSFISDKYLSLAAPVIAYWALSLVFHVLDSTNLPYFEKRRIHESPEVLARNRATMKEVFWMVIFQQAIQTVFGLTFLEDKTPIVKGQIYRDDLAEMSKLAPKVANLILLVLGWRTGEDVLKSNGEALVRWAYWWGIPATQIVLAFFVIDTWQYFMHRAFHTSCFLYRHFHSWHHRLYVPYAFGALYNHPVEGLLLDTISGGLAHEIAKLTVRQDILLFTFSTLKTVDDHCGYKLWWDPLQMLFPNNADYHDVHHQAYGIKANFSQPFFTNWDKLLGTQMTRGEAKLKTRRVEKTE